MGSRARKKKAPESVGRLLNLALRRIAAGDGKQALDLLKHARLNRATEDQTGRLFYRAYLLRARALDKLGLARQARTARKYASRHRVAPDEVPPSPSTLLTFMEPLSDEEGLPLFAKYLRSYPPHLDEELELAARVVLQRCWEHLELLRSSSRFRLDADTFASALPQLDRGDWNGGCQLLRRLAWESGFHDLRTLSVAMAAHKRGDSTVGSAALRKLRSGFPLRKPNWRTTESSGCLPWVSLSKRPP